MRSQRRGEYKNFGGEEESGEDENSILKQGGISHLIPKRCHVCDSPLLSNLVSSPLSLLQSPLSIHSLSCPFASSSSPCLTSSRFPHLLLSLSFSPLVQQFSCLLHRILLSFHLFILPFPTFILILSSPFFVIFFPFFISPEE